MARANELEGVGSCLESSDEEYAKEHDEEDNDENDNNVDDDDNGGGEFNNGGSGLEGMFPPIFQEMRSSQAFVLIFLSRMVASTFVVWHSLWNV
ncbi:unnamed protein product [Prunus armeniaca]